MDVSHAFSFSPKSALKKALMPVVVMNIMKS
eukprot:CAMPEP_0194480344 /NCGR_PEP_ID=MMETSP0253-20130528/3173_1 /TAXON_ID=2966 /ORGANISM="Noctiluca scintillans" /LENGTH=30 /DNA_ID= /DNA_START= /DNA_END= /DNA_ORIENTATION=